MSSQKIGRKKFFLLTGIAALGTALTAVLPFGKSAASTKKTERIKISPNPNAVHRINRKKNG